MGKKYLDQMEINFSGNDLYIFGPLLSLVKHRSTFISILSKWFKYKYKIYIKEIIEIIILQTNKWS